MLESLKPSDATRDTKVWLFLEYQKLETIGMILCDLEISSAGE